MDLEQLGLVRSGMLDYPGRVAATLFTMGCPLRCPYCHNPELLHGSAPDHFLPRSEVLAHLRKRVGLLQGVVITGGEPLMHRDLPGLLRDVSSLSYDIKLDTSGYYPDALQNALACDGVQFVAMDLKTSPKNYGRVDGGNRPHQSTRTAERILRSITNLREWKNADTAGGDRGLEFRTTCAPGVVGEDDLEAILDLLQPGESWVLQKYRSTSPTEVGQPTDRLTEESADQPKDTRDFNAFRDADSLPITRQAIERIMRQAECKGVAVKLRGFQL